MMVERFILKDKNGVSHCVSSIGSAFSFALYGVHDGEYAGTILEENTPGFKYDIVKGKSTVSEAESLYKKYLGYI